MGRPGGPRFDEEAPLEPLLAGAGSDAATGGGVSPRPSSSRGLSPDPAHRSGGGTDGEDYDAPHGQSHRSPAGGGGTIRLKRTSTLAATQQEEEHNHGLLVVKEAPESQQDGDVRELEVEVVAGAVAEAVAEAVQEAVQEAVHDAVQQALEDHVQFDVTANIWTLVAVTGVILFWRGVWQVWDVLFGDDNLWSQLSSLFVGLGIMLIIRLYDLPLVQGLPGG